MLIFNNLYLNSFSSFVQSHDINEYLSTDEFQKILREIRIEKLIADHKNDEAPLTEDQIKSKLPEGSPVSRVITFKFHKMYNDIILSIKR